jgi:hypothetical protein
MSPGLVFEESGFSGSLSGLSKQKAAHVDPGVVCSALPRCIREMDESSEITNSFILGEDNRRVGNASKKGMARLATSPAWQTANAYPNSFVLAALRIVDLQVFDCHRSRPVNESVKRKRQPMTAEDLRCLYFNPVWSHLKNHKRFPHRHLPNLQASCPMRSCMTGWRPRSGGCGYCFC